RAGLASHFRSKGKAGRAEESMGSMMARVALEKAGQEAAPLTLCSGQEKERGVRHRRLDIALHRKPWRLGTLCSFDKLERRQHRRREMSSTRTLLLPRFSRNDQNLKV